MYQNLKNLHKEYSMLPLPRVPNANDKPVVVCR